MAKGSLPHQRVCSQLGPRQSAVMADAGGLKGWM
jgi:hypothetical protein